MEIMLRFHGSGVLESITQTVDIRAHTLRREMYIKALNISKSTDNSIPLLKQDAVSKI